jgi:hypothetical protein
VTSPTKLARWALVGVGAAVVTASAGIALSAPKPVDAPSLTAKPSAATSSTTATFTWTGPSNATFECARDTTSFTSCASPKSYPGLAAGSHTFQVRSVAGTDRSAATSHTWTIDTTPPPVPTVTARPTAVATSTTASFAFSSTESGVSYQCRLDGAATFTSCANPAGYSGLAQGSHAFAVRSADAAGNVSPPTSLYTWTIDSVAPPAPVLTQKPTDPAVGSTHVFSWTDSEAGVTFECALENGSWFTCSSPYSFVVNTTSNGQHQFAVRAVDTAGNRSAAASYTWKVVKDGSTSGMPFTISGTVLSGLTPGTWRGVPLKVSNPNAVPIYVTALTLFLPADGAVPGCSSSVNLALVQSDAAPSRSLLVPANGNVTLPAGGVAAPRIQIKNLATVNQDGCKGKTFMLAATGTANN